MEWGRAQNTTLVFSAGHLPAVCARGPPLLQCPAQQAHLEEEEEDEELLLAAQVLPSPGFLWDGLGAGSSW